MLPHSPYNNFFTQQWEEFSSVNAWKSCWEVTEGDVRCEAFLCYVVLYDREQTVDCIMDLSARSSPKLVFSQCILGFCKFGQTRNQDSLKKFCQRTAQINTTIWGRVSLGLVTAFIDWLHKWNLPRCWLDVMSLGTEGPLSGSCDWWFHPRLGICQSSTF